MSNKKIPIRKNLRKLIKSKKIQRRTSNRKAKDALLYSLSIISLATAILILSMIIFGVLRQGYQAFMQTKILLRLELEQHELGSMNYQDIACASLSKFLPLSKNQCEIHEIISSKAAEEIQRAIKQNPGQNQLEAWVTAAGKIDMLIKGKIDRSQIDSELALNIDNLMQQGLVKLRFNRAIFTSADSSWPERAGLLGAIFGSLATMLVCIAVSLPIGILTGIYLQEFAPKNKIIHMIRVNIYNLASTPSVVFGLLGGYLYLEILRIPRSSPLAGGLTLALIMLPIVIIITKQAIKNVPQSVKNAALALGASHAQALFHHVLPLALPEIMTGIILGIARILGETAPLLIIGMAIFTTEMPNSITDASATLSTQIYLWSKSPEIAFKERTGVAIITLILIIALLNILAAIIKNRLSKLK